MTAYNLEGVITFMSKELSKSQVMRDKLNAIRGKEYAKTFSSEDDLLQVKSWIPLKPFFKKASGGEGFPCGHITQIIGKPDSGKTTLMMEGMVACQKKGGVVYLIDAEHKFSMSRFALMGGTPEDIIVIQVESLEEAWDAIQDVCKVIEADLLEGIKAPNMICWDSVAASVPKKVLDEEDAGDSHMSPEARVNNKNVRKLRQFIKRTEIACCFINHYYMTVPKNKYEQSKIVIKGGEEMEFFSTLVILTKQGAKITRTVLKEDQQIGRVTKFTIHKGHFHGRSIVQDVYVVDKGILETEEELTEYKKSIKGDF